MHRVSLEQVRNEVDRWLTADEAERLLTASSLWLQEIIRFALNTGMRQGEILNLQWQDVIGVSFLEYFHLDTHSTVHQLDHHMPLIGSVGLR